jgi:hypothetical protein
MKQIATAAASMVLLLGGCASLVDLRYGGVTYRGKNAQEATLGAIGVENAGEFESKMLPNLKGLRVRLAAKYSSSDDLNHQSQIDAAAQYAAANGHIDVEVVKQSLRSGNFQILKLADINRLIRRLNGNADARRWLELDNARVVTSVVVAYDARYHSVRSFNVNAAASATALIVGAIDDPTISLSSKSGRTIDLKINDGFVVGYELSVPVIDSTDRLTDLRLERGPFR